MAMDKKQMGAMKEKAAGSMKGNYGTPPDTGFQQSTGGLGAIDVGQGHKNLGKISPHHDSANFSNQTLGAAKEAPVKEAASDAGKKPFKGDSLGDSMDS